MCSRSLPGTYAKRLEGITPRDELVNHGCHGLALELVGFEVREILEVIEERESDRGAYVRHLQFGHDHSKMFDGAHAAQAAVTHEARGFVVPFAIDEVDRVLQRSGH